MGGGNRDLAWGLRRKRWFVVARGRFFSGARVAGRFSRVPGAFASRLYGIRCQTDLHCRLND